MNANPVVSFCIAAFNRKTDLKRCLNLILENVKTSYEIIVVDNGSTDGTVRMLTDEFPNVRVIPLSKNIGYAPAVNKAWKISEGKYLINVSSDAEVMRNTVEALVSKMEEDARIGIIGPKTFDGEDRIVTTCHSARFISSTLCNMFFVSNVLRQKFVASVVRIIFSDKTGFTFDYETSREVPLIDGGVLLIRKTLVNEIGYLDDRIFLGPDDYDYCLRARRNGHMIWYEASAKVIHRTSYKGSLALGHDYINRVFPITCYFVGKHYGRCSYFFYKVLLSMALFLRSVLSILFKFDIVLSRCYFRSGLSCLLS